MLCALLAVLFLSRRPSPAWMPLYLAPVLLTWLLTQPRASLQIWIPQMVGGWQVLTLEDSTRSDLPAVVSGGLSLNLKTPLAESGQPGEAVSWVERGALLAPRAGGDPAYWPFLRHWSDARLDPSQRAKAIGPGWQAPRRWEIDAHGHFILRPLP